MGDLRTSIILDLSGNLQRRARQFTNGLDRLGRRGSASMQLLGRGVSMASRGLDRLGNRYTALITGAAGIGAIRQVGNLEERLTRLGIQADRSANDINTLKKVIFETAKAPDIRVNPGEILSAVEEIIEKTGDLKFAEENIRNIGLAISATGAGGLPIGGILAEFQKMGLSAREAYEALDILNVQGKQGAFTLQNLASLGPRVVTAYTAMGRGGVDAIREMGAILQVIMQGSGSPEQAATSFEALMRVLGDAKKAKLLQQGGIKVFDAKELERGRKVLRPINRIMQELVERVKGDRTIIQQVLGDSEAAKAFNAVVSEFARTGNVESIDRFFRVLADGSTTTRDARRAANTFNASLRGLYTVWAKFSDDQLAEPVKKFTEYLDGLKPGTVERWLELGASIAKIGAGLVVVNKFSKWLTALGIGASSQALGAATAGSTAAVAAASHYAGKKIAEYQIGMSGREALNQVLARESVTGLGPGSPLSRQIRDELDRRDVAELKRELSGNVKLSIESNVPVRVDELKSSHGLDIDVDSGRMMVAH